MKKFLLVAALAACHSSPSPVDDGLSRDIDALAARTAFRGTILVGRGTELAYLRGHGVPEDARWRWASVTKQMTAILIMQEVAKGTIDLQAPVARYLPSFGSANAQMTVEQLLRHQSGLPNTDDQSDGVPPFFQPDRPIDPLAFCAGPVTGPPGGNWVYNNCDYIVAGALLESVTGRSWQELFDERIAAPTGTHARLSVESDVVGEADGRPEPAYAYERYGAAGALVGTVQELWAIDRALAAGTLLPESARAVMWTGVPDLGFMALGQWVYEVPLRGCAQPVKLVERRGAIGGIGVRNFIVPASGVVVIALSKRAELEFGELWSGSGFGYELVSLAACPR